MRILHIAASLSQTNFVLCRRLSISLAVSLTLFGLNLPSLAQGIYGAGSSQQLRKSSSKSFESEITQAADLSDGKSNLPSDQKNTSGIALHDADSTTDPWFACTEHQNEENTKIAELTQVISIGQADALTYADRAQLYLKLHKSAEAAADANKVITELKPESNLQLSNAYCFRGQSLIQQQHYEDGLKDLLKAISLDDENAEAIYFRGMARERLGQLEMARQDYRLSHDLGFAPNGVKVDFSPYMQNLESKIKENWMPPKGEESRKVQVYFKILRNGQIENVRIGKNSGMELADQAGLRAVKAAAPFQSLPVGAPRSVDIQFSFDYNVLENGLLSEDKISARAKAEKDAQENLEVAKKGRDKNAQIACLLALGDVYRDKKDFYSADQNYKRAKEVVDEGDAKPISYALVLSRMATVESLKRNKNEAEKLFKQSIDLALQSGKPQTDPETGAVLRDYAKFLYKESRFDDAKELYARFKH